MKELLQRGHPADELQELEPQVVEHQVPELQVQELQLVELLKGLHLVDRSLRRLRKLPASRLLAVVHQAGEPLVGEPLVGELLADGLPAAVHPEDQLLVD